MINFKKNNIPFSTQTIDRKELEKHGESIYSIINIVGKRANQINNIIKNEIHKRLNEITSSNDSLDEVIENKEQIELSKFYEKLPKPTSIALQEFLDKKILFKKNTRVL